MHDELASRAADISVVVPTRERFEVLEGTLAVLARQRLDGIGCELLVVDNDSADGSRERLETLAASGDWPFSIRVLCERARGAAAARNAGVAAARAPLVLFLGDDCRPLDDGLVAGHVAAHEEEGPGVAVVGRIDWDSDGGVTPVMRWLDETGKMLDYRRLEESEPGPFLFYTGNASVEREAIVAAGGFDERFQGYGWEDFDLALRMADNGLRVAYRPQLPVAHAHRYTLSDSLARMQAMGHGADLLNRLHPQRTPPPAPRPRGIKAATGRALAPLLVRLPAAERLPGRAATGWFKVAHWSALASGYGRARLPAGEELRGGVAPEAGDDRPAVSVIVPFHGSAEEGRGLFEELARLRLGPADEAIVVDNTVDRVLAEVDSGAVKVVPAPAERSSYYARNTGAEAAGSEWLLFVDSDCRLRPDLVDAFFLAPPGDEAGAIAGAVVGVPEQTALVARYARSRGHLDQAAHLAHPHRPFAVTANMLVRRAAWEDAGGFFESLRSSGDADFSWRIQELGWRLDYRPEAVVEHHHRESIRALVRQNLRYGAGRAWIARQHAGSFPRPKAARRLARHAAVTVVWLATLRFERAAFSALDGVVVVSECAGWFLSNSSVRPAPRVEASAGTPVVLVADRFPELSETFVAGELLALQRAGRHVRVEAAARPVRPGRKTARGLRVDYLTDDGLARRFGSVSALVARHPVGTLRDLAARRRWRREEVPRSLRALAARVRRIASAGERHVHVHFADTAALDAMRCAALLRVPYSVSAHAYEVFRDVRNLPEKLTRSAFSTGESMYATEHLRSLVPGPDAERIHLVASGVDTERFRRSAPYPGGRTVVAVGRLIEKKGFGDLIAAAALLREADAIDGVLIAGGGPLAEALAARVAELEVDHVVELLGAVPHHEVRNLLERADVFAMPSVVAADGDRDSMPNVVYEALAMEIPVVATEEVGLPEVVRPEWGRLVPPGDPKALAGALAELLGMPAEARAAMGLAGRKWVMAERDVDSQAAKLGALIDASA